MGPGDRECRASGEILHSLPPTAGTIPQGFHGRPSRSREWPEDAHPPSFLDVGGTGS